MRLKPTNSGKRQQTLPGVRLHPTGAEIRAEVKARAAGFELRQAERDKKRKAKNAAVRRRARP